MIILLYGQDTYRSRQRLKKLRDAFKRKFDASGMNTVQLDGETLTAEGFNKQFNATGFLAEKRFFAVLNLLTRGAEAVQRAVLEMLEERKFTTDNILVFWEDGELTVRKERATAKKVKTKKKKRPADTALMQGLLVKAKKEEFNALAPDMVAAWIQHEVEQLGGTIEMKAVALLASRVGSDLWQASNEIAKLVHYKKEQVIGEQDVDLLVATTFDDDIFRLTDAIGQRNAPLALKIFEDQFQLGTEPLYLLRMLAWHLRNLVSVRSVQDQGVVTAQAIANQIGIHPFVAQKAMRQTAYFSLPQLFAAYDRLAAIDSKLKSTRADARALFDLFALSLTRSSAPRSAVS